MKEKAACDSMFHSLLLHRYLAVLVVLSPVGVRSLGHILCDLIIEVTSVWAAVGRGTVVGTVGKAFCVGLAELLAVFHFDARLA